MAHPLQRPVTLLLNGRVHADPGHGAPASAIAIEGHEVVAVGDDRAVRDAVGDAGRVVDLAGATVLPAFIESHTHFHRTAMVGAFFLDFEALRPATIEDVLDAVRARAATLPADAWIQGDSLSAGRLAEDRWPDRHELDEAGDGRPVALRGIGKHVVAASSAALAAAGIDRTTQDPPGGRIERDADGAPTGVLHERAKLRLDQSDPATVVPAPGPADRRAALRAAVGRLHELGIGTIHEMIRLPDEANDWAALHAAGELGVRVRLWYRVHESPLELDWLERLGIRHGQGDDWLKVLGVKVSVDGFCIFRNAAVYQPYRDEPANRGLLRVEPDRLCDLVARASAQGLQVAVHAVGARAVDHALDAFAQAGPPPAGHHRIEHAYLDVDEPRLRRMHALGLAWSTQPSFRTAYAREWASLFDPERRAGLMPLAAGDALGLPMLFNSDTPCAPVGPLDGIRAATEPRAEGAAGGSTVSRVAAWRASTTTAADVAGEPRLGRLTPGALADLAIFDADPLAASTDLAGLRVRATMVDGVLVHQAAEVAA